MAQLAIKGHPTRGKEVIEIFEMLGGKNIYRYFGNSKDLVYFINSDYYGSISSDTESNIHSYNIYSLEDFLEKYPYKVGDKVQHKDTTSCGSVFEVEKLLWEDNQVKYIINRWFNNDKTKVTSKNLQLYKEEKTMGEKETFTESEGTLVAIDLRREFRKADNIEVILGDYDFVFKDGKTYFVKNHKYPKTYEECCEILEDTADCSLRCFACGLLNNLQKLLLCRNAYWKIVGEEMGLDEHWEPDVSKDIYTIRRAANVVIKSYNISSVLEFPTPEIRDAFYENFKDLIERCKELL